MPKVFGHRGNSKNYLENTMDAFINCHHEGIETDVRLTDDNIAILHHDNDLYRIYGYDLYIDELSYVYLKFKCKSVVLLEDFLIYCKNNNKIIVIDIKECEYFNITLIIDNCINFCKNNNYDIKNIIFLTWKNILKPRKNIIFLRAISYDKLFEEHILLLKIHIYMMVYVLNILVLMKISNV
jgi:glycerophosphoryl diester phosphodiesterase